MQDEPSFDGKAFVANLSSAPGVYRMIAASGDLLYVGKAGNLKKRVGSYFLKPQHATANRGHGRADRAHGDHADAHRG